VVDVGVPAGGEVFDDGTEALAGEVCLGVFVDGGVAFLFEEPLAEVLLVARLRPVVVVDVEGLLLLALLLGRRDLGRLLPLCRFGFLCDYGPFEVQGLVVAFRVFWSEDCEVPDGSDVFLDPVEILADEFLLYLAVVAEDDVAVGARAHLVGDLLQGEPVEVEEGEPVTDGQVLEEERLVVLDQVHAGSEDVAE
jgi:hypothetical protein